MRLVEADDTAPDQLIEYHVVLSELCRVGKRTFAEELAWTAIETGSARHPAAETLRLAGPFLLAVEESEELRAQTVELYRACYGDRDGFEALLSEAGLGGGRPVRRALRTLDVCLALHEGAFLIGRYGEGAAKVEKIDAVEWRLTISTPGGRDTLSAVALADRYRSASPDEFAVMLEFAPDELAKRLSSDPAAVVIELCKERKDHIDSDELEELLVPRLLDERNWKKWWNKARTALKRSPHIKLEGRSPHVITYVDQPILLHDELLAEWGGLREPVAMLEAVEKYLRACKARGEQPSESALGPCSEDLAGRARRLAKRGAAEAGLVWMIALRIERAATRDGMTPEVVDLLRTSSDLNGLFQTIDNEALLELACDCLVAARPEDWAEQLMALLPAFPLSTCDRAARRLIEARRSGTDMEPLVQRILVSPIECFDALLWLWDGPSQAKHIPLPPPVTLLSRIVRAVDQCRRGEQVSKERARKVAGRARSVLSARKYARFEHCLAGLEAGMAGALRTQIRKLDNLGAVVRGELLNRIDHRFPPVKSDTRIESWMREDVLYVTETGLARKQAEIEHHVNVKMRENAKAIGSAAERGDLSENSEYKFALEERDLLRARLAQMNAELAVARIIAPADVPTDHVGIGTKVFFKRLTDGVPYNMLFLGPWEADGAKARYNYKAPLAQRVLGKRVGDVVEFDHSGAAGSYEIVALENVLALDWAGGE